MNQQQGFSLIAAVFVLVVLSSVAGFAVSIAGITRNTAVFALQGARAYYAAKSGLEWSFNTIKNTPTKCFQSPQTLTLTQVGLQGFNVIVTCKRSTFVEGVTTENIFLLNAVASKSSFGGMDYVARELQATAIFP